MMKQEVTRLQEMLNRLDFKRKVRFLYHHAELTMNLKISQNIRTMKSSV